MSNEEQAQREPGIGPVPDGPDAHEGPAVVDPDDVVLDDGDGSADTLDPELSVSPEALDLEEPALGPARISTATAEAASLEEAAAEARAAATEAEETGALVGGPLPADAPLVRAAPDGTAPAGGTAGDVGDPAGDVGDPAGGAYGFAPEGGEPGLGHPGLHPGTDPAFIGAGAAGVAGTAGGSGAAGTKDRTGATKAAGTDDSPASGETPRADWVPGAPDGKQDAAEDALRRDRSRAGSSNLPLLLVIGGAVVLLGLLAWLLVSLFGGSDDEQRVDPSSLAAGECLADFTEITEDAARVDCSEPHNAQLVASENYPDDAEFPGRDQLGLRAEAACANASSNIDPDVVARDLRVTLLNAIPTTETWADGDRRVDCFAVVEDGGTLSRSLLDP